MDPGTFFTELKRRKVYRVAVAYAIVAWLLVQAVSILFPTFEAPAWVMKVFVTAVVLGFPVALILAWAFDGGLRLFLWIDMCAPHSVTFIKELPKIATGKIQKYVLRARQSAIAPQ